MSNRTLLRPMFGLTLVVLLLAGCRGAPAGPTIASTPIPPTVTAAEILPTQQPIEDTNLEETDQLDDNALALRTALAGHFEVSPEEVHFSISEQTEEHTIGSLSEGYFLAARVEDAWVIVYVGQATPGCAEIAPYDFTIDMVPECLDANNNLVSRAAADAETVGDDTEAIRAALIEKTGIEAEKLEFTIAQNTGTHARGTLKHKDDVSGGYFIAAKVDSLWVIAYDGQATPSCAEIASYNFPVDMVPECLDAENNLVVRTAVAPQ